MSLAACINYHVPALQAISQRSCNAIEPHGPESGTTSSVHASYRTGAHDVKGEQIRAPGHCFKRTLASAGITLYS